MKRTLSIASRVPPAVTSTLTPASDPRPPPRPPVTAGALRPRREQLPRRRRAGSRGLGHAADAVLARRRQAARCRARAIRTPRARSVSRFARVAGCSYMREFIAGASSSGQRAASAQLVSRLSARPRGELGDRVGRRGGDQEQVGVGHQLEVADAGRGRAGAGPGKAPRAGSRWNSLDEHRRPGQRGERGGADEAAAGGRLHDAHGVAGAGRQADELERLVRGDPAADAEQYARHGQLVLERPGVRQPLAGRLRAPRLPRGGLAVVVLHLPAGYLLEGDREVVFGGGLDHRRRELVEGPLTEVVVVAVDLARALGGDDHSGVV